MQFKKGTAVVDGTSSTIEGEWLNGRPHGICIVDNEIIRGVMSFNHGKVEGVQWFERKIDGTRQSFEYINGENHSYQGSLRRYNNDKSTSNTANATEKVATPGWLNHIAKFEDN